MTITIGEARQIANAWHGGQGSALYSFASTGQESFLTERTLQEIEYDIGHNHDRESTRGLVALWQFVDANIPERSEHWHVVAFINGCLNDYDSGPIDTIECARSHADDIAGDFYGDDTIISPYGEDSRIVTRKYSESTGCIIAVESCTNPECLTGME